MAEDRKRFSALLHSIGVPQADGKTVVSFEEALGVTNKLGYPVLVRPSYVIGGHAMEIVSNDDELFTYTRFATKVSPDHPILVDKYLEGREVEVDAICDGVDVFIPGIFEHIERAGVHSGDSMTVYPPYNLSEEEIAMIRRHTIAIGKALNIIGLMNIQFVISKKRLYCIEVNPRASRTVPILSKVSNVPMVNIATKVLMGISLKEQGLTTGLLESPEYFTIKAPVFSFDKLKMVETSLGPEMKSTGEVLGLGHTQLDALSNAITGTGLQFPSSGKVLLSIANRDKKEAIEIAKSFISHGFELFGTTETFKYLTKAGIIIEKALHPGEGEVTVLDLVKKSHFDVIINTPTKGKAPNKLGFKLRRLAVEYKNSVHNFVGHGKKHDACVRKRAKWSVYRSASS